MKKALLYGVLASFFFAFTFVLNRSMNLSGGYWLWSACLRYLFMLPMLAVILWRNHAFKDMFQAIKKDILSWLLWSTIGFGLFYLPLSLASIYGESWLVASSWQITIVAGILLTPLFGEKIPKKNLSISCIILIGVFMLQLTNMEKLETNKVIITLLPIILAAFAYPLGNRKMMKICPSSITTIQRVFGMTLCSMPFWIVASLFAFVKVGMPSGMQVTQSILVALFSGVIATILFFKATDLVKSNPKQLALIEATQSGEVFFSLLGGIAILGDPMPSMLGIVGICFIIAGMIYNSLITS
jgi:drug/metabolite transporter (DMT)-like permease